MVGISEKYGGNHAKSFDIFRTLGLNPFNTTINTIDELLKHRRKAALKLHEDCLRRCHAAAPPDVDLATLNGIVDALEDYCIKHPNKMPHVFNQLNTRGRTGWRSTWNIDNVTGQWIPHVPQASPSSGSVFEDERHGQRPNNMRSDSPPQSPTFEDDRHGQRPNNVRSDPPPQFPTFEDDRRGRRPNNVRPDPPPPYNRPRNDWFQEKDAFRARARRGHQDRRSASPSSYSSSARYDYSGPRCQIEEWAEHAAMKKRRSEFQYRMGETELRSLGQELQGDGNKDGKTPLIVIGVVRRRDEDKDIFPEYVVTAGLTGEGSMVIKVRARDIESGELPPWGNKGQSSISWETIEDIGYKFPFIRQFSRLELRAYLMGMRKV